MRRRLPPGRASGGRAHMGPVAAAGIITAALVAPWVFGFAGPGAVAGHLAFAMAFAPIALLAGALPAAGYVTGVAGAWLMASPWALGYASAGVAAWAIDLLAGLALIAISRLAVRDGR